MTSDHLPLLDDGIDVRLRGVKIKSSRQRELGLNADLFQPASLVRYPRLEGTDPEVLYRRAVLLQRWLCPWAYLRPHPTHAPLASCVCVEEVPQSHGALHWGSEQPGPCPPLAPPSPGAGKLGVFTATTSS